MTTLITFFEEHKGITMTGGLWLMREWHIQWPKIVAIYPYLRDNGGAAQVIKNFFVGKPKTP